jgi:hypothetical protein
MKTKKQGAASAESGQHAIVIVINYKKTFMETRGTTEGFTEVAIG